MGFSGIFTQAKASSPGMRFTSRAEAFAYMLAYQIEERKADPMEAAKRANEFADIFAKNMGIPTSATPPPEGLDKYLQMLDKTMKYCEEHPKTVEIIAGVATGAVTFLGGLVTGKKIEQEATENEKPKLDIDFDQIPT